MSEIGRIGIYGIGVIGPQVSGIEAFRERIRSGVPATAPVRSFETAGLSASTAGLVTDFQPKKFIAPMKLRRMSRLSRLGAAAAIMAVRDGGVDPLPLSGPEVGVALGTAFGTIQVSVEYLEEYVEKGAALAPPQLFAESVANAPASHIAIAGGYEGFNLTFTQRESSVLTALMFASAQIAKGATRAALVGGVDETNEMIFSILDRIGALAHSNGSDEEASRPFDARRNGMVVGEGSSAFLLAGEGALPDAREPYAWISGFGTSRDASASLSDWGNDPAAVVRSMRRAIVDAELEPGDIDGIIASANSTIRGDRLEYLAIQQLFGKGAPPVAAPKSYFGEYACGGGATLATALVALREQELPATPGFEVAPSDLTIPVTRESTRREMRHLLVNSLSAGGGVVCAVISRGVDE
ncbi:MAG: beta-ketoacyl synthase N-terminal-like domain-containing protein [Thermoanaerobaculia bacterium]